MAEAGGPAKELADGLGAILRPLSEFFHLFDLSFFVSGATTFAALTFLYVRSGLSQPFPYAPWVGVLSFFVACYVCGLASFAAGRFVNAYLFRDAVITDVMAATITAHGIGSTPIRHYLDAGTRDALWALYVRLWADISYRQNDKPVFRHLMRYWVMAATFDGLGASFCVWALVVFVCGRVSIVESPISSILSGVGFWAFVAAAVLMFKRGANFFSYQVEDLVATLIAKNEPLL